VRLTTSPPLCAECHGNLGAKTSWNHLDHTGPVTGLLYIYPLPVIYHDLKSKTRFNASNLVVNSASIEVKYISCRDVARCKLVYYNV